MAFLKFSLSGGVRELLVKRERRQCVFERVERRRREIEAGEHGRHLARGADRVTDGARRLEPLGARHQNAKI